MPSHSWVARYGFGDMTGRIPGVYALHMPKDSDEEEDAENGEGDENFVVDDDNYEWNLRMRKEF